jgi:ABC-type Fe3+/spermidine/putrescine transport system ATPase subunit
MQGKSAPVLPLHDQARAPAMLTLRNVSKRFGASVDAVRELNFEVRAGEFVFLLGPSGSGKTTTLRMIAGFGRPTSGEIELAGKPISDVPPHRRDIGMVFQRYALFPHLTVWENTVFGLKMRGMPEKERPRRVEETLAMVRLTGFEKRYPHELSGGQQQRVALARALAYRPALLLLDEPLANLDRRLRDEMRVELKRIQQEAGTTMLFVTHDQEEALTLGDRIAVMHEGRLEQVGTPLEIYHRPASRFVASFIGDMNFLRGDVVRVDFATDASEVHLAIGGELQRVCGRFDTGASVVACIRPERVRLQAGHAGGGRDGVVTYAGFSGDSVRYLVGMPDGTEVLSREPIDGTEPRFTVGQHVEVTWPSGELNAFAA